MFSKRAIAVAADTPLRKRVSAALVAAGCAVDSYRRSSELSRAGEVDLAAVCTDGGRDRALEEVSARLPRGTPIIAIIPTASLEETVSLMGDARVSAVLAADELECAELANVAARLLFGDVFGAEKLVPWGVRVHAVLVGDYEEKTIAIREISEFAETLGVRRKYRELIEQCLDEMLMNALYDAPPEGRSARDKGGAEKKALVEYACDGAMFALSVRDGYGGLDRDTVVWYLDKCLHASEQIDRKEGGAGLGLYLIANASTHCFVNLHPGEATEVSCRFDLTAPKVQLKGLGIFEEKEGAAAPTGQDAAPRAAAPRGLLAALASSVAIIVALIGVVAYPRLAPVPEGDVRVTTEPAGAEVELGGERARADGDDGAVFSALEAGEHHIVTARKAGFEEGTKIVTPREDAVEEIEIALEPEGVDVLLESEPSGAEIYVDGELRGRAPRALELPAGSEHEVRFEREDYVPHVEELAVSAGEENRVAAELELRPDRAALALSSDPPGASVSMDGEALPGNGETPIEEHRVAVGEDGEEVELLFELDGYAPKTRRVALEGAERSDVEVELEPGGLLSARVNVRARVSVPGLEGCEGSREVRACAAPAGPYRVVVSGDDPFVRETFEIGVGDADVSRSLTLGVVATASDRYQLDFDDAPEGTRRAALRPGAHTVPLLDTETGETEDREVEVEADETTHVGWE